MAQRGDFDGLCAVGDGNCGRELDTAGRDAVPPDAPTVAATRALATTTESGQQNIGGMVLVLCGTNGRGEPYRSEMLVFRDGGTLRGINTVYWDNFAIAANGESTAASPQIPSAGCGD